MSQPTINHSPATLCHSLCLFLFLTAFFIVTMGGHTYSSDEETVFVTTESLARYGHFSFPQGVPIASGIALPSGDQISKYGPLKPLLQLPLYGLGNAVAGGYPDSQHAFITRLYVAMFNPLVQAAIAALLFAFARRIGYATRASCFVALLYALATFAWPHSRTQFAEPLSALLLFAALYAAYRPTTEGGPPPAPADDVAAHRTLPQHSALSTQHVLSGLLLALALAAKFQNAIVVPIIFAYVGWGVWQARRAGAARWWLPLLTWGAGFVVGYLPLGWYNLHYFGGFFSSGYGDANTIADILFATPLQNGLYNLLLSAGKGLLWFALPLILLPFALPRFWRQQRAVAAVCLAVLLLHLFFYATNRYWHADGSWGPRYLMPALAFACLPLVALMERLWAQRSGWQLAGRGAVLVIAALAVTGQLFGAAVNFDTYINQTYNERGGDVAAGDAYRYFTLEGSPLLGHPRWLAARLDEWGANLNPPADAVTLVSGFSLSEGANGAMLPRWTHGAGVIHLPASVTSVTLTLADHRPPSLARANVQVMVDSDRPAPAVPQGDNVGSEYRFRFDGKAAHTLTISSDTWNPASVGIARDETIGVSLADLRSDPPLPIVGAAIVAMPQVSGQQRYTWFYRPDVHHLLDWWGWYLRYSGLSPTQQGTLAMPIYAASALLALLGLACFFLARRS